MDKDSGLDLPPAMEHNIYTGYSLSDQLTNVEDFCGRNLKDYYHHKLSTKNAH